MPEIVSKEPIAIVGVGCVLPDAPDVPTFWNNLLEGRNSIREVPKERWDPELYWDADKSAVDKTYAKIGAFVEDDGFDPMLYRMPPKVVDHVDRSQRWALAATRQALIDAGYVTGLRGDDGKTFNRDRCAVIIGNAMGGETNKTFAKRLFWPEAKQAVMQDPDFQALPESTQRSILEHAEERYKLGVPPVSEDTMPGHLSNVVAGRIANAFDLGGKNFTTDAACASSLAALDAAVDTLRSNDADMVVWGGTDRSMDITGYIEFSKIGALSPDGSRPFDEGANGFVMGEGCAMFVLKRLRDAERDGDNIYAVVRGIGSSSDGKGKGITAPNPAGQVKAVRRCYEDAGIDPYTVGYLEAHGTSTPVGDPVELQSVMEAFAQISKQAVKPGSVAVGSVKSNIGHLKAAAGAAGVLKTVLAIHQKTLPPSINVKTLNPRIDWATSPFAVQMQTSQWAEGPQPRRAAVSSFGFGGTNFHVALEQYVPGQLIVETQGTTQPVANGTSSVAVKGTTALDVPAFQQFMETRVALESEPLVLDGATAASQIPECMRPATFATDGTGARVRDIFHPVTAAGIQAETRLGVAVADPAELPKKLELAQKALANPAAARLAFNQGVFLGKGAPQGKVAFLFPGQGTQYVNMCRDLAEKYEVVRNTFHEADEVLVDALGGIKLTDILWPTPDTPETQKASNEKLKLTEFTQPAVLAADVAILRLLNLWGIEPDVVAGHSLGEYGALVAAGVLSFADALQAVAARGREMAQVKVPDLGKMAAVPADWETVQRAIANVEGYVIPANKNCPSQTVLAGSTAGIDAAVATLKQQGLEAQILPVSAAFHSDIVAPASEPLRRVLGRLDVNAPQVRCLSNVGAEPYGNDPEAIRDNLAIQVANPVEWIDIMERMYNEGVRTFIEVGPKRALTGFCLDILKDKGDVVAICANHPKKGGIQHVNELFAFLGAWGFQPDLPALNDATMYTPEFREPTAQFQRTTSTQADPRIDIIADKLRDLTAALEGLTGKPTAPAAPAVKATSVPAATTDSALAEKMDAFGICLDDIGISGVSVGLPGTHKPLFADDNFDRILAGENLIDALPEQERQKLADKNIVRLQKGSDGSATFQVVSDIAQVIKLAGRRGSFDLGEWGVKDELVASLDSTFQYAIAAGLEALREAGIPLQRTYMETSRGGYLPKDWKLPEPIQDETGIIFASAFPGYDKLLRDVSRYMADKYAGRSLDELQQLYQELIGSITDENLKEQLQDWFDREFTRLQDVLPDHGAGRYEFNRKFLFEVLSMGHSQFAQLIGARGPNTQVNAACASTTQAVGMAEDWIRTGRCRRVLVIGADDVTSDAMFEWIGSGFLASGAATTKDDVTQAALPFDARRHGMIVGMGAVGIVVEAVPEVEARGMRPMARVLATEIANSAFHGSRLDVPHITGVMTRLMDKARRRYGIDATSAAAQTVFVSHETYTPARGGSASAEINALRATFGTEADRVVIANTKGFTGHPQGAGVEDAIAIKMLQRGQVPPIANFRDPDPELGNLNLSKGGTYDVRYALRLAAGFGSQVAMTLTELVAKEDARIANAGQYEQWLAQVSGIAGATTEVENRTLRIVDQGPPARDATATPAPVAEPPQASTIAAAPVTGANEDEILAKLIGMVAEQTGYPTEMLEPDLDMEADLGIDTVKQAELFGAIREHYALPLEEGVQIKDYPTLRKVAGYFSTKLGGSTPTSAPTPAPANPTPAAAATPATTPTSSGAGSSDVLAQLTAMVAEQTGYPIDMLEPDLDMEADLGIDTVKQAELFGAMREAYNLPLEEGIQIKDYPTLRRVAEYFGGKVGGSAPSAAVSPAAPAVPTATAPATPTPAPTGGADSGVLDTLIGMVAEQTGYPVDMLEPDLDMEADLGIDTVKQAELFGAIRDHYGLELEDGVQIKDYPTLRRVAEYFSSRVGQTATAPAPVAEEAAPAQPSAATEPIVRRVPSLRPYPVAATDNNIRPGPVLVIGDGDTQFLDAWKEAGFEPAFRLPEGQAPSGILCLATRAGTAPEDRAGLLFETAKAFQSKLGAGTFIAVVTAQDGAHGLHEVRDASMGAVAGLGKALRKEIPEAIVKVIDVHPDLANAGSCVVQEVMQAGVRTEVCYDAAGQRFVVDVVEEEMPDAIPDVAGKGIVVSGGAQGITVEMLLALAEQKPRLLLLGRTQQPPEAAAWAQLDESGWKAKEQEAIARMQAAGEKVTPVSLKRAVDPMRKAAEVYENLQRLQDAGAEVLYAPVDVTNLESVAEAVTWARQQWGRIDGVIHAAGVEISKDLASKDRDQFNLVFGIKVQGWNALMEATRDDALDILGAFSSVAGRFGNIGQTDYSAANEFLAKAVKMEASKRGANHAFTIAWGPWGQVGMATRGSIMQIMEASGVTPIPTIDGVRMFLNEMANNGATECVVAGALGAIDVDGQLNAELYDAAVDEAQRLLEDNAQHFRLLEAITAFKPGKKITATVIVDQARDPALKDHCVDGVPYLPGVFGIEAFAQAAGLLAPGDAAFLGASNVRFLLPLKQLKATPQKGTLTAEVVSAPEETTAEIACHLTSQFHGPDGKPLGEPKLHFEATLRFGANPVPETTDVPMLAPLHSRQDIYPPFFHGPSFQVLDRAGPLGNPSVALWREPTEQQFGAGNAVFLSHPMVTEALFQTCGLGVLETEQRMCLPAGIEHVDILTPGSLPESLRLVARPRGLDDNGNRLFDAVAVGKDGTVAVRLTGFAMVEIGGVPETTPEPTPEPTKSNGNGAPEPQPAPTQEIVTDVTGTMPFANVELPTEDDIHFVAVPIEETAAEPIWFTDQERATWADFPVAKRANDWRAGRLAVKRAMCDTHPGMDPRSVTVVADATTGRPRLYVDGQESALWVSITHRDGLAIAAVSPAAIGIDLETVEERAESFLREVFSSEELMGLQNASNVAFDATCMWAAKEAALKRAGVGLNADLRAHQVGSDGQGGASVEGPEGRFGIRFFDIQGQVLAVSAPHMDLPAQEAR